MGIKELDKKRLEFEKLKSEIEKLELKESLRLNKDSTEVKSIIEWVQRTAKEHMMADSELLAVISSAIQPKGALKKQPLPAKYASPDDASLVWSGKGKRPGWIVAALESGYSLEDLLIR